MTEMSIGLDSEQVRSWTEAVFARNRIIRTAIYFMIFVSGNLRFLKKTKKRGACTWNLSLFLAGFLLKLVGQSLKVLMIAKGGYAMYSSMVRPAMVYGLEPVAVTKKQVEEMEVAEIKMLMFAMGVMRKDKIRNELIRSTVKVEWLEMKMRKGRLRWYGHVMRRDQEYVGRKMMETELLGKRRRGRPKRRFLDVVKKDMGEVGVKETDVEDRKMWRMMICCGHP